MSPLIGSGTGGPPGDYEAVLRQWRDKNPLRDPALFPEPPRLYRGVIGRIVFAERVDASHADFYVPRDGIVARERDLLQEARSMVGLHVVQTAPDELGYELNSAAWPRLNDVEDPDTIEPRMDVWVANALTRTLALAVVDEYRAAFPTMPDSEHDRVANSLHPVFRNGVLNEHREGNIRARRFASAVNDARKITIAATGSGARIDAAEFVSTENAQAGRDIWTLKCPSR